MKKRTKYLLIIVGLILIGRFAFIHKVTYDSPELKNPDLIIEDPVALDSTTFKLGKNWLRLNEQGNWECYVEGDPYERGLIIGKLQRTLLQKQEEVFIAEIEKHLPGKLKQKLMLNGIAWFNRNLPETIPNEYLQEIYGVSQSFSDAYDNIGPKFNRILNYHAAHDIGHMAQNMNLVGCSAGAKWSLTDQDSSFILGRNFDFYFGDDFAQNKIILFCNPTSGYSYSSVTWGGFCGVVSGINEAGLSITLNALPADWPTSSSTPVSIISRDILQYASTMDEALAIAKKYDVFVSESFTIGSKKDGKAAIIEKSPGKTFIYYSDSNSLIATNHYQSDSLKDSQLNKDHRLNADSDFRFAKMKSMIDSSSSELSPTKMAKMLRAKKGPDNENIGFGNPMAINQLLAHHSIIFDYYKNQFYISSTPFQEGTFSCYDFSKIAQMGDHNPKESIAIDSLAIQPSNFSTSSDFSDFKKYKKLAALFKQNLSKESDTTYSEEFLSHFIDLNPYYYEPYALVGHYYFLKENQSKANTYYTKALEKPIAYKSDIDLIKERKTE